MPEHAELAVLLRAAYAHLPQFFAGSRTWSYVRPEARVVGRDVEGPAAHAGVLRRFLQVGGADQLAAVVGLVAVRPGLQRQGVGLALLERVQEFLDDLAVPFGILMCAEHHVPFYERGGWCRLSPRRSVHSPDDTTEPHPFVDEISTTTLVLPVRRKDWPDGEIHWNGATV
ncbi:NodA family N-acyltransferase [Pseudonocardia yuanmonensis]|uniref:NodA family N-acyltransferase n=2 Tax=Pseudonocardia yuanmonensis TaxID=1095914 RepID=A0ABP8XCL0_9PSEU